MDGKLLLMKSSFYLGEKCRKRMEIWTTFLGRFFLLPVFIVTISFAKANQSHINQNVDWSHPLPETEKYLKLAVKAFRQKKENL